MSFVKHGLALPLGRITVLGIDLAKSGLVASGDGELRSALGALRSWWVWLIVATLVGGVAAFAYAQTQEREYRSSASLYVTSGSDNNSQTAYQGSLASQQRIKSYQDLATSEAVLDAASANLRGSESSDEIRQGLVATSNVDTVVLNLTVTRTSPQEAARVVNAVANAMSTYVQKLETPLPGARPLAKLTVVTPGKVEPKAVSPRVKRDILVGAVAGLLIAALFVLAYSRLTSRLSVESDILALGLSPVIAAVPADPLLRKRGLISFDDGASAAAEAYRKLRTNLTFANVDHPPRSILVTSAVAIEGKTTTAMNLAGALVETGSRVVLVDADLRRPQVNARTGLVGDVGFTNFLRGDAALNDLVQPTQVEGLWVLASGPRPPNPAELVASKRAEQAVAELSESFDYVIIDSPPVLPVTDAVVLSQWVDGVLLVVRSGSSKAADLGDAHEQVSSSHTPVIGFVLTGTPAVKGRYGYYGISPKRKRSFMRAGRPKAIEQVLEPKRTSKH
ncbi:polysaccharide biosynthesis tyrosine autokinase [Williamsia serinedens]|uniref:Capsular exopolysaccharide family n=1 Tax=Williamsia serinedens TaxID=391736 RepID=A0ABT1H7Q9_9NOCA|nr:polysaccharide biosynthesis tyrosine autokinase [Williamsia serinedens]MCP2161932.1 capsular exopolysaccharide family [Williamsia serinedens]